MSDSPSVHASFAASARRWADRPFLHIPAEACASYHEGAIDWSYAQATVTVAALAADHGNLPLRRGHRVALMLGNRPEFIAHYLALNSLGVSVVPLNPESSPQELAHILGDSGSVAAGALPAHRELLRAAVGLLDAAIDIRFEEGARADPAAFGRPATAAHDEAALLYTSGSTGAPKGCMLSNAYMTTMGRWYCGMGGLCAIDAGRERLATPLPLVHMNALAVSLMAMILSGGCLIQLDRFHPKTWWRTVRGANASIIHYLGVMPAILLQLPAVPEDSHTGIKFGFGAGVHPRHHLAFEQRFGFPLVESWSMTEVGGAAAVVAAQEPRHVGERCFGRPTPDMQWRLVDESGAEVPVGDSGELRVRAAGSDPRAGFFSGYNNQPALTEAAWEGSYFHTGDVVRCGADGALHFVDRKKSIIRRSGENIASLEVEAVLNQLADIQAVGVGPVDDEIRGEEVMACIQLHPPADASRDTALRIFAAAAQRLVYYKLPGYIAFVDELPLTASQKLQRGELKKLSAALIARQQVHDLRSLKKRPENS